MRARYMLIARDRTRTALLWLSCRWWREKPKTCQVFYILMEDIAATNLTGLYLLRHQCGFFASIIRKIPLEVNPCTSSIFHPVCSTFSTVFRAIGTPLR